MKRSVNKKLMSKYKLDFKELEIEIKGLFSELNSRMIKNSDARDLILTDGDVALGVYKELM